MFISATPFNWMEVSLRYADINLYKYSPFPSFSGDQTYKDKSFNLKFKLIEEGEKNPELSIGFRDFIGTGNFSSEYIVSSKKIGDFDISVGLGWGNLSSLEGLKNPFIDFSNEFEFRDSFVGKGGNFEFDRWFRGAKVSSFYGLEYLNKRSGLRFKFDYDSSNPFGLPKESNFSYGLSIPASKYIDINLFRHRGTSLGFGISYKANYSEEFIPKNEFVPSIAFNENDQESLSENDEVFFGTMNVLLQQFGIFPQKIYIENHRIFIVIDQSRYRNLNLASKRIYQIIEVL